MEDHDQRPVQQNSILTEVARSHEAAGDPTRAGQRLRGSPGSTAGPGAVTRVAGSERRALLALARLSVERALDGLPAPEIGPPLRDMKEPRAAFVTIRRARSGLLRGCRGESRARRPLPECVSLVAVSAALDDPRFPPVTRDELPLLRFEISALTAPQPIRPGDVVVGRHGLLVTAEAGLGLLLPQVPIEQGWDRQEFLEGVCVKAGLARDAWRRSDLELSGFEAEVWSEE